MLLILDAIAELRKVAGSICNAIYSLISILFDVFYNLANIRILNARYGTAKNVPPTTADTTSLVFILSP